MKVLFHNHTSDKVFQDFEQQFKSILYEEYEHLSSFHIDCYTTSQYQQLERVPKIVDIINDAFAYSIYVRIVNDQRIVFAAIVFSPALCEDFHFTEKEKWASIAHEIGHIVHYFNDNLKGAGSMIIEMKADEVAIKLGLAEFLQSVLHKLKLSKLYSIEQCQLMDFRIQLLNNSNNSKSQYCYFK